MQRMNKKNKKKNKNKKHNQEPKKNDDLLLWYRDKNMKEWEWLYWIE